MNTRYPSLIPLLPPVVALLLYLPALHGGLVWDDPLFLYHPLYRQRVDWGRVLGSPFVLSPNYFRPLAVATLVLGGLTPWVQHLLNLLLHVLNTGLVTLLAARLRRPRFHLFYSLAAGLLYAVHPALVEGVAFVSGRFDLLLTTFLLLALLADGALRGRRLLRPLAVGTAVLLAALSKEMAVAFPFILPLWHLATASADNSPRPSGEGPGVRASPRPLGEGPGVRASPRPLGEKPGVRASPRPSGEGPEVRASPRPSGEGPGVRASPRPLGEGPGVRALRREWPLYLAVLLALSAYLGLRTAALGYLYLPGEGNPIPVGGPLQHGLLVARSLAEYTLLALWPFTTLRPIHYSPLPLPLDRPVTWLALPAALAVLGGVAFWLRRDRRSGSLALAALLALLPVLNLLPLELGGGTFVAERFLLFPLALLALSISQLPIPPLAAFSAPASRLSPHVSRLTFYYALALWFVAAVATVQWTVPHWRDERALWEWGLRRAPQSSTPYTNLALVAVNGGDPAGGLALAEAALARDPNEDSAHNHRGLALFHLGRYEEAEAAFRRAIDLAPDNALYRSNLAGALREQGRLQEAERVLLEEALPRDPSLWVAHFNLGLVYLRADRPDLAAQALEGALGLAPPDQRAAVEATLRQTQDPARWLRLGDLLLANGEAEGALGALAQAEALGAGAIDVAVGRSAALIALGRLEEAEALLQAALLSAPQDARLYNNLGLAARQRGDTEAARGYFERAVELAPEWDLPRRNLEELAGSR